jgi:hypothetical protein
VATTPSKPFGVFMVVRLDMGASSS